MKCPLLFLLTCVLFSIAGHAQTARGPHVYLTHRKPWLASGGFDQKVDNRSKSNKAQPDYTKEFQRLCPSAVLTDLEHADYAVTIDNKKLLSGRTNAKAATFQFEVYSRQLGPIFAGGEDLLRKAVKQTCSAVADPNPRLLERGE